MRAPPSPRDPIERSRCMRTASPTNQLWTWLCWYTATHVCVQRYMRVIVFLVQCTEGVCASVLIARDQLDDRPKEHLLIGCYLCEAIDSQLS